MDTFIKLFLVGLGTGAIYAIAAHGMVLIFRGSGVLNFAQGAMIYFGASFYVHTADAHGKFLATVFALGGTALVGAFIQVFVMRPLRHASPLMRVIATLGMLAVIQETAIRIWGATSEFADGLLSQDSVNITDTISVSQATFWMVGIAIVLTAVLWVSYRYTQFGRATTAVAEDELGAAAVGWSPQLIATVNWALGGALAGLAGVLLVDTVGSNAPVLTILVVPALASALIGGFRSFPITLVCALAIGVVETEIPNYISAPGWPEATPFIAIILYLVIRGKSLPLRGHLIERLPRISQGPITPPIVIGVSALMTILVIALPDAFAGAIVASMLMALVALSLVVVTGYAGQLSLAQYAMAGMGALFTGRMADAWGMPFIPAFLLGILFTIPIGVIVGLPALRTRGVNLAILTLGLALVVQNLILANPDFTGGPIKGTVVGTPTLFGWDINSTDHPQRYAIVTLAVFLIAGLAVSNLRRGRSGRRLVAIRNNERAAASLGINIFQGKLYAFSFASAIAAAGGALAAFQFEHVDYTPYTVLGSATAVLYAVTGGIGSVAGAMIGGTLAPGGVGQWIFGHWWDLTGWITLIAGALAVLTLLFQPDGIALKVQDQLRPLLRKLHRKETVDLPATQAVKVAPKTLEVSDVAIRFGGVVALDGVSLSVAPGEIVGLIGPNGAGKTTLIDIIAGNTRPDRGAVMYGGDDLTRASVRRRAQAGIGRSFQSLELFEEMTVIDNLRAACDQGDFGSYLRDLILPREVELSPAAVAAIEEFGLADELLLPVEDLPYGRRHLVALARAVALGPSVLLLDEPAAGLDSEERDEIARLVTRLAREWGMAILFIEHDVDLVMRVCDRVVALDFGAVITHGTPDEVRRDPRLIAAYLGDDVPTTTEQVLS